MRLTHSVELRHQQNQRIDPRQILASEILAWTTPELEAAVEREMAENPALEARDGGDLGLNSGLTSGSDGAGTADGPNGPFAFSAGNEERASTREILMRSLGTGNGEAGTGENPSRLTQETGSSMLSGPTNLGIPEDDNDPLERVVSHRSLRDHLREQIGQVVAAAIRAAEMLVAEDEDADEDVSAILPMVRADIVSYLVECVDERGYLIVDTREVAEQFRSAPSAVDVAIRTLQTMDPPGIGARDLRECLVLQAEYLEAAGEAHPLARRILRSCWDDLVAQREERIASRLRAPLADVRAALRFLRQALTPYPGAAFRPAWGGRGGGALSSASSGGGVALPASVRPDIVFHRTEAGFVVELTRDLEGQLLVAPMWQKLAERGESGTDEAMRRYVRDHVDRAQAFLNGVARRGRTLRAIARNLLECQLGFIETGNRAFLRPLTRQALAEKLGLDESVISRAVAEKWAQLPGGEVVALDAFFGNAHAVREALVNLIASEDPANPLSDDEIADCLTAQGFPLARRTVAKYRGLEKILPARLRKRAPSANACGGERRGSGVAGTVATARNAPPPPTSHIATASVSCSSSPIAA